LHHLSRFRVQETAERYQVTLDSSDGTTHVHVDGTRASQFPQESVFSSLAEASQFFERGSLGYSPSGIEGKFDGLELRSRDWSVEPLALDSVQSSFFDDRRRFPAGSVHFDCALLMNRIRHEWHGRSTLNGSCCP
jgi:hypothetical protein